MALIEWPLVEPGTVQAAIRNNELIKVLGNKISITGK